VAYADDISVATIHKDAALATRNLQLVCHFVEKWLAARKLFLNAAKTVFILFSRKRLSHPNLFILLNGVKIFPAQEVSFLGLLLDANLNWCSHLDAKCTSARRALLSIRGCLRQSFGVDSKRLRFLYSSVVEPTGWNKETPVVTAISLAGDYMCVQNCSNRVPCPYI
jgi:hypothetical protein